MSTTKAIPVPNNFADEFIRYNDIAAMWPIQPPPDRATVLRWSRAGSFPSFHRPVNQKSEPVFAKADVETWLAKHYAFFAKRSKGGRRV